jgi:estrone sulfotransferase
VNALQKSLPSMPPAKLCPPERLQKRPLPPIRIRPDDVFIVSYPRSGNTWVRFLLANLLAPDEKITFRNIEKYVPSIYKSADSLDGRRGRRYIKSHNPCYELYPKIIYVYRDGRDALVSYYYYATGKRVFSGTFEDFIFSPFIEQFESWKEHVARARDFASKYPDRILILRYEDMLISTLPALTSISAFLGLTCDSQDIAEAVRKSSFEHLQKVEQKSGGETLGKKFPFFRTGRSNQWRDHFTPKVYQQFLEQNEQTLRSLGYQI